MVSAASSSNFVSEVSKVSSVPVPSLSSVMPLQVEKVSLPSAVLANGGNVSFSMPEACLDCGDGDIIIGEELDELLDSVPDPDANVMVRLFCLFSFSKDCSYEWNPVFLSSWARSEVGVKFPSYTELYLRMIGLIFLRCRFLQMWLQRCQDPAELQGQLHWVCVLENLSEVAGGEILPQKHSNTTSEILLYYCCTTAGGGILLPGSTLNSEVDV